MRHACMIVALALSTWMGSSAKARDAAAFERQLVVIERLMTNGRWRPAFDKLEELLREHERQPYVISSRDRILEDLKRCSFRVEVDVPEIGDLISGKLVSYDRRRGEIELLYTPETMGDFQSAKGMLVHPLLFDGPYKIEVRGDAYPSTSMSRRNAPTILCGFQNDEFFLAGFGLERKTLGTMVYHTKAILARQRDDETKVLDSKDATPCRSGEKFALRVSVGRTRISAAYNGRTFLSGPKSKDVFGTLALQHIGGRGGGGGGGRLAASMASAGAAFAEIEISGDAQTAWVQGLEDRAAQKAFLQWEKSYDPSTRAPRWLLEGDGIAKGTVEVETWPGLPGDASAKLSAVEDEVLGHVGKKRFALALAVLEEHLAEDPAAIAFLRAQVRFARGEWDAALEQCAIVERLAAGFLPNDELRLRVLLARSPETAADAEPALRALLDEHPGRAELAWILARHLYRDGRLNEAHDVVVDAAARGVENEDLETLGRALSLAIRGPRWGKSFEHESRNYHVHSNIDVATCRDAALMLEQAYAAYSNRLRRVPGLERRRFTVYLFAGQAGYEVYVQRVLGGLPPFHTAGVYSPSLKQLFIWNQRDREGMMRTVRHEGFHQYLDRIADDAPRWFNEGLAEYYEIGGVEGSSFKSGQIHEANLAKLREEPRLVPARDFLFQDPKTFYGRASLHYAQAWALVHFLRHAPGEKKRFDALFDLLAEGVSGAAATERAFEDVDWQEFDRRFAEYVASL
ncbi:MAG: DUF1570 domain-containing protein [Planctomycetota bacterium JB042]